MCEFCEGHENKPDDFNSYGRVFVGHGTKYAGYADLLQDIDESGRPFFIFDGYADSYVGPFYPRFCPLCGKNLDVIYPKPQRGFMDYIGEKRR